MKEIIILTKNGNSKEGGNSKLKEEDIRQNNRKKMDVLKIMIEKLE